MKKAVLFLILPVILPVCAYLYAFSSSEPLLYFQSFDEPVGKESVGIYITKEGLWYEDKGFVPFNCSPFSEVVEWQRMEPGVLLLSVERNNVRIIAFVFSTLGFALFLNWFIWVERTSCLRSGLYYSAA